MHFGFLMAIYVDMAIETSDNACDKGDGMFYLRGASFMPHAS